MGVSRMSHPPSHPTPGRRPVRRMMGLPWEATGKNEGKISREPAVTLMEYDSGKRESADGPGRFRTRIRLGDTRLARVRRVQTGSGFRKSHGWRPAPHKW